MIKSMHPKHQAEIGKLWMVEGDEIAGRASRLPFTRTVWLIQTT